MARTPTPATPESEAREAATLLILKAETAGGASLRIEAQCEVLPSSSVLEIKDFALYLDAAGTGTVTKLDLALTAAAQKDFAVPLDLLEPENGAYRLKTKAEIEVAGRVAIEQIEAARDRLKERLAEPITLDATQSFLGATAFASLQLHVSPLLFDPAELVKVPDTTLLEARARLAIDANFQGESFSGNLGLKLSVRLEDLADLAKAVQGLFDIDLPDLPGFELDFPSFSLPDLTLDGIDLPIPEWPSLLPISLPHLPETGLEGKWTTEPKFELKVVSDNLQITTTTAGVFELSGDAGSIMKAESFELELIDGALDIATTLTTDPITVPVDGFGPIPGLPINVIVEASTLKIEPEVKVGENPPVGVTLTHEFPAIRFSAKDDPSISLSIALTLASEVKAGGNDVDIKTKVTELKIVEPYPIQLLVAAGEAAGRLLRLLGGIPLPNVATPDPNLDEVLRRIGALLSSAARQLSKAAGAVGSVLAGVAEALSDALMAMFDAIVDAGEAVFEALAIEVRLDPKTYRLRQVILMPAGKPKASVDYKKSLLGIDLSINAQFRPALVIDLTDQPWYGIVLFYVKDAALPDPKAALSTDLWLKRATGPHQPLGTLPMDADANAKPPPLIQLEMTPVRETGDVGARDIVLAAIQNGRLKLFQALIGTRPPEFAVSMGDDTIALVESGKLVPGEIEYGAVTNANALLRVDLTVDPDLENRALALLPKMENRKGGGTSLIDRFVQRVKIEEFKYELKDGGGDLPKIAASFNLKVIFGDGFDPTTNLGVEIDLETLSATFTGGDVIDIEANEPQVFHPLGLELRLDPKPGVDTPFKAFRLDLRNGREAFGLGAEAKASLSFRKISTSGRGLVFDVDAFGASRSGFDLTAKVRPDPVTLGGVDVPFRFTSGGVSITGSKFAAASLTGAGQLPPALVGEANATIALQLGADARGNVEVLGATARLDKSGDPIRCNATMFELTISELEFDFVKEGNYHFYFLLTGSAVFKPSGDAYSSGLLKNFRELEIRLDKAPLGSDPRVLLRAISFHVKVDPPKSTNFFDIFSFDLRGIGFYPAAPKFDGAPAMTISGQVKFADFGDMISPRFDFHKMWIAGPARDGFLPRVRFDGLTVGLKTGALDLEATAIAVDDSMPDLYRPDVLPADVRAEGFLAAGRLDIKGWASMSAAMGFLQMSRRTGPADPRHAFFIYGQMNKLTEPIDTPVGRIYLREFGFGFGKRYTLGGIAQAETAKSPRELVAILDEVSKYQGNLDSFEAWEPTYDNNDLTLALRGMFSIAANPSSKKYNEKKERDLPNPVLFDIVAAFRTDLTFLINLRGWIAVNYNDWATTPRAEPFKSNPTMRGYLYFSVPRKEFLARMIADGEGYVGEHPRLDKNLVKAIRASDFSATLYIRPGLFHMELGWPYELGFTLGKPTDSFYLSIRGGLINRIEDFSLLYGMAFKAEGRVYFEGRVGNYNLGASAVAEAKFSLEAKIIAYLSLQRFNDTLFYGMLRFDLTLTVSIKVWLRFKIDLGFDEVEIKLEAGFPLHLAVSIGLEAVITPKGLGGRAHVAVGVRAFGRTLSVGIGVSFNDGLLEQARARVARFMALGLTADIPPEHQDGQRVETAPRPDPPRNEVAGIGDSVLDNDIGAAPPPMQPAPDDVAENMFGRDIGRTDFWAMLYPLRDPDADPEDPETFIMQLIPRDNSDKTSASQDIGDLPATFFTAPFEKGGAATDPPYHELVNGAASVVGNLARLTFKPDGNGGLTAHEQPIAAPADLIGQVFWKTEIAKDGDNALNLGDMLGAMFLHSDNPQPMSEPRVRLSADGRERLPDDREASAEELGRIGRSRAALSPQDRREQEIEESRSAIIATISESAAAIASRGKIGGAWPAAMGDIDARYLGLTFVVNETQLDDLFEDADTAGANPRKGKFTVQKSDSKKSGSVALFNPPERMFRRLQPGFTPTHKCDDQGIKLNWDLEPAWRRSASIYDDPEYHLKHYRIRRRISGLGENEYLAHFTVKAAEPTRIGTADVEIQGDAVQSEIVTLPHISYMRAPNQFIDDLRNQDATEDRPAAAIPAAVRDMLLGQATSNDDWDRAVPGVDPANVKIEYDIVPVDIAGTVGYGETHTVNDARRVIERERSPREATLQVLYQPFPRLALQGGQAPKAPMLRFLCVPGVKPPRVGSDEKPIVEIPEVGDFFGLRILVERTVPSGGYGNDALDEAKRRPDQRAIEALQGEDVKDFALRLSRVRSQGKDIKLLEKETAGKLLLVFEGTAENAKGEKVAQQFEADILDAGDGIAVDLSALVAALGATPYEIENDALSPPPGRGARIFMRALAKRTTGVGLPWLETPQTQGEWRTVSPNIQVLNIPKDASSRAPLAIDAVPETFEQPVALDFKALGRTDLQAESGRLHIAAPGVASDLSYLTGAKSGAFALGIDPQRRTATRVTWNARPRTLGLAGPAAHVKDRDLFRWIGGFELFGLDPDILSGDARNENEKNEEYAAQAKSMGRVALLPADQRGLTPSGFGDFSRLEAAFPSQSWRVANAPKTGGVRQAAWFSSAESLPVFPEPGLRRALMADPDDGVIATMFANGRPDRVVIKIVREGDRTALAGWRLAVASAPRGDTLPNWGQVDADALGYEILPTAPFELTVNLKAQGDRRKPGFDVADLRLILQNLRLVPETPDTANASERTAWQKRLADDDHLAGVGLRVEALRKIVDTDGKPVMHDGKQVHRRVGVETIEIDLLPDLHPVLSDTLAFLQYARQDGRRLTETANAALPEAGRVYRRYSLVPDAQPPSEAKSLPEYIDATPAERDPHGFGALRSLGLAAGFQLFDTETGDFIRGTDLVKRVNLAMGRAMHLYGGLDVGQPFVDILTRPWGNSRLFWFDGGQGVLSDGEAQDLLDTDALAAVQLSLRPRPNGLGADADQHKALPVRYYEISAELPDSFGGELVRLDLAVDIPPGAGRDRNGLLVDVMPVAGGLEAQPPSRIDGSSGRVALGAPDDANEDGSVLVAVLRVASVSSGSTGLDNTQFKLIPVVENPATQTIEEGTEIEVSLKESPLKVSRDVPVVPDPNPAFGKFPDLSAEDWADVIFRPAADPDSMADTPPWELDRLAGIEALAYYAERNFGPLVVPVGSSVPREDTTKPHAETPDTRSKRTELVFKMVSFWQRYLEHCALPNATEHPVIDFSLGTVADPGVWQQAPDHRGRVSVVIPDADRRGARRAFAVRPYGRYEDWADAARQREPASAAENTPPDNTRTQGLSGALDAHADLLQFVDVTLPRTEPLAKPVILATSLTPGPAGAGRLEVVVAHGADMTLGAANRRNAALLAPLDISMGLWREFPYSDWMNALPTPMALTLDPLAPFGLGAYPGLPGAQTADGDAAMDLPPSSLLDRDVARSRLVDLRQEVPDAWLGATVFSLSQLPYFFRMHALFHTSAGIVVSEHAVASFDEGFSHLTLPWDGVEGYAAKTLSARPIYAVKVDGQTRIVEVDLPAARFIDCMPRADAELWFGKDGQGSFGLKDVVHLPEPQVSYRLSIETLGTDDRTDKARRVLARVGEIDVMPDVPVGGQEAETTYLSQATGSRFDLWPFVDDGNGTMVPPKHHSFNPAFQDGGDWRLIQDLALPDLPAPLSLEIPALHFAAIEKHLDSLPGADILNIARDTSFGFVGDPPGDEAAHEELFQNMADALSDAGLDRVTDALTPNFKEFAASKEPIEVAAPAGLWVAEDAVFEAIEAFFGTDFRPDAGPPILTIFLPPSDTELELLVEELVQDGAKDAATWLMDQVERQLFGENRALGMQAARGPAPPVTALVRRRLTVAHELITLEEGLETDDG